MGNDVSIVIVPFFLVTSQNDSFMETSSRSTSSYPKGKRKRKRIAGIER
jgi:hypothetical protein